MVEGIPLQIKNYIITGLVSNFFYAPYKNGTSSLQKRKHYKKQTQNCILFLFFNKVHIFFDRKENTISFCCYQNENNVVVYQLSNEY